MTTDHAQRNSPSGPSTAHLHGINALGASEGRRGADPGTTPRSCGGHRVLHLVEKGTKPATIPLIVPVLPALGASRGQRTPRNPRVLRPVSGKPIDRRDVYRMVLRIAKFAGLPRQVSQYSLRHAAAITNALDAGVLLRDAQTLPRQADPAPPSIATYDRARGNLDGHGVYPLAAYVAGV